MTQASFSHGFNPYAVFPRVPAFPVTSTDISDGEPLPALVYADYAGGENQSPQLSWSGFPAGTRSFMVTLYDPDAPSGSGFWHWAVANIPAHVTSLPTGAGDPAAGLLPEGAVTFPNDMRQPEFTGAGPAEGSGVHRYWFVVHALGVDRVDVDPQATPALLGFLTRNGVLARGFIVPTGQFGGAG